MTESIKVHYFITKNNFLLYILTTDNISNMISKDTTNVNKQYKFNLRRLFMKIMILSDSHSMTKQTLLQFIKNHPASYYIHCGDIYMPYTPLEVDHFYNVRGNNDFVDLPKDLTLDIDHLKFFICHGHLFHIDESPYELEAYASNHHLDVVCFGHTHNPTYYKKENTIFINPGSMTFPRGQYPHPTYCVFETTNQEVTFYDLKTDSPCNPFEVKKKESFFKRFFK